MTRSNNPSGRPRSEEVTERLHAAVLSLLRSCDFASLTMERVAATAGVTRPSLYRRYGDLGELTLEALIAFGDSSLRMRRSASLRADLQAYFRAVVTSLSRKRPAGRALRGVLAHALTHAPFAPRFAAFIEQRRRPVVDRVLAYRSTLPPRQVEALLDSLFGPILYRLLVRQRSLSGGEIDDVVHRAVAQLESRRPGG